MPADEQYIDAPADDGPEASREGYFELVRGQTEPWFSLSTGPRPL